MITFAHAWLFAILPLPLLVMRFAPAHRESATGLLVPFFDRLARLTGQTPTAGAVIAQRGRLANVCLWLMWVSVVGSLARPQWLDPPITKTIPVRDLLIAVDLSGSMQTQDFTDATGKSVDRLTAVKQVLDDFLSHRQGDRVGLIVFGNAPFVQAPFTQDLTVCRELLAEMRVGMAGPKTAMGDAMGLAITVFEQRQSRAEVRSGDLRSPDVARSGDQPQPAATVSEKVLIVLTDGNDTGSLVPPAKAAEIARDQKITVHTIAVGDPKAAGEEKLDEETLKLVAKTTGGTYSHAGNRAALEETYRQLDALPTQPAPTITHRPRRDLFCWPLAAGFLISFVPPLLRLQSRVQKSRTSERRVAA